MSQIKFFVQQIHQLRESLEEPAEETPDAPPPEGESETEPEESVEKRPALSPEERQGLMKQLEALKDQLHDHPLKNITAVASETDVAKVRNTLRNIRISEELLYYIVDLVSATRSAEHVVQGASVRASLALLRISQAVALFDSREFIIPEDIFEAAPYVLSHRLTLTSHAQFSGVTPESVVTSLLQNTTIPI